MKSLHLGPTQITTSRLAYGCWRIAGANDEAADFASARRAVLAAVDAGYTLFDHADIYCDGRAEAAFGKVLRETPALRGQMVIATKCGIRFAGQPTPAAPYRYDFSAEHIVASCETSLKRLGIETIDVYQLHRPDWLMDPAEVAGAFDVLYQQGKVREFGVSNFNPSQLALLQSALPRPLIVQQIEVSLLQLGPFTDGTLDQCLAQNITPLAWSPLGGGLLADGATDILPAQKEYLPAAVVAALDALALARGTSRSALALAWLLRHPARIVPIIGSTDPERIRAAVAATEVELTREEWYHLLTVARGEPLP